MPPNLEPRATKTKSWLQVVDWFNIINSFFQYYTLKDLRLTACEFVILVYHKVWINSNCWIPWCVFHYFVYIHHMDWSRNFITPCILEHYWSDLPSSVINVFIEDDVLYWITEFWTLIGWFLFGWVFLFKTLFFG